MVPARKIQCGARLVSCVAIERYRMSTRSPTALEASDRSRRCCRRSASIVAAPHARKTDTPTKGTACRSMPGLPWAAYRRRANFDERAVVADQKGNVRNGGLEFEAKIQSTQHCCNSPYQYLGFTYGDHLTSPRALLPLTSTRRPAWLTPPGAARPPLY